MFIEWRVDLFTRPQSQAEWDARSAALQNANLRRIEAVGLAVSGSLKALEEQVHQAANANQHRPMREAFREYERELAALVATGMLSPGLQADDDRSVTVARAIAAKAKALPANADVIKPAVSIQAVIAKPAAGSSTADREVRVVRMSMPTARKAIAWTAATPAEQAKLEAPRRAGARRDRSNQGRARCLS